VLSARGREHGRCSSGVAPSAIQRRPARLPSPKGAVPAPRVRVGRGSSSAASGRPTTFGHVRSTSQGGDEKVWESGDRVDNHTCNPGCAGMDDDEEADCEYHQIWEIHQAGSSRLAAPWECRQRSRWRQPTPPELRHPPSHRLRSPPRLRAYHRLRLLPRRRRAARRRTSAPPRFRGTRPASRRPTVSAGC
jgi:hypothetical protein